MSEGRRLADEHSRHQFRLGDLALMVEPIGRHGGAPTGATARLNSYAREIGVDFKTLAEYRWVSSRWAADSRRLDSASWSAHQALAPLEDRAEVIASRPRWTAREARETAAARRRRERYFEDVEKNDLLPRDGCCPTCGTHRSLWPRLRRWAAA